MRCDDGSKGWTDVLWEGLNPPFLALKMEEGSQAVWAASRAGKMRKLMKWLSGR